MNIKFLDGAQVVDTPKDTTGVYINNSPYENYTWVLLVIFVFVVFIFGIVYFAKRSKQNEK